MVVARYRVNAGKGNVGKSGEEYSIAHNVGETGPSWSKSWTDFLGRSYKSEMPGANSTNLTSQQYYNAKNQVCKSSRTGQPDTLMEYDELGAIVRSGLDIDGNGSLTLASMDRIVDSDTSFAKETSNWYSVSTSTAYPTDGTATALPLGTSKTQLTGLDAGTV